MVERFGASVPHVVIRNEFFGRREEDWIIFDGELAPTAEDTSARLFGKTSALVRGVVALSRQITDETGAHALTPSAWVT